MDSARYIIKSDLENKQVRREYIYFLIELNVHLFLKTVEQSKHFEHEQI